MYNYFQPTTDNRVVTNNRHEAVLNSYDNTIRYTDLVLDSIIARMKNRCAIVFYISDHGESLGENGNWLHAAGAEETKYPACMIWYSDVFAQQYPEKITALYANKNNRYRTDFLFHSVLSAAGISVVDIDSTMNIFETYHH